MKKIIFTIIVAVTILLTACGTSSNRYYVKYEMTVSSIYSGGSSYVTVNTEKGEQRFQTGKTFSETFGPVKRNFHAEIKAYTQLTSANVNVRIYVCRGDEEFTLKDTETMSYTSENNQVTAECWVGY
jgi:hypothetical protein